MIAFSPVEVAVYYASRVPKLRQRARRWRGPCPIHRGGHDSFSVDSETGLWHCFSSCGRGGDVITLEMALTGATWRDAACEIERIIGRPLLDRPARRMERRVLAQNREREQREIRGAMYFQFAAVRIAEHLLDDVLPPDTPDRYKPTQLLLGLRAADRAVLLAIFRDFRSREPRLTEALIKAGERGSERLCIRLARFVEAQNAA